MSSIIQVKFFFQLNNKYSIYFATLCIARAVLLQKFQNWIEPKFVKFGVVAAPEVSSQVSLAHQNALLALIENLISYTSKLFQGGLSPFWLTPGVATDSEIDMIVQQFSNWILQCSTSSNRKYSLGFLFQLLIIFLLLFDIKVTQQTTKSRFSSISICSIRFYFIR